MTFHMPLPCVRGVGEPSKGTAILQEQTTDPGPLLLCGQRQNRKGLQVCRVQGSGEGPGAVHPRGSSIREKGNRATVLGKRSSLMERGHRKGGSLPFTFRQAAKKLVGTFFVYKVFFFHSVNESSNICGSPVLCQVLYPGSWG